MLGLKAKMTLRTKGDRPFRTDCGNAIVDCAIGRIDDPARLSNVLSAIPGVVDHGLFIGICGIVLMGTPDGVTTFRKK